MVVAGYQRNQPGFSREAVMPLYAKRYSHQCPATPKSLDAYLEAKPAAGMPFGLPAIASTDLQKLAAWVANGSPGPTQKVTTPRIQKNHFVWRLNKASLAHLKKLFLGRDWDKTQDMNPPWGVGNPFLVFRAIPAGARSLFLLENSEVIVGGITYGPVCLGQTATYAVKDQFWVYFLDPRYDPSVQNPELGLETWSTMMDRSPSATPNTWTLMQRPRKN
jgi:hypothetical protein